MSVAVLVTVVVPTRNVEPLAGSLIKLATPQLSVALTLNVTLLLLHWPASALATMFDEQVITGSASGGASRRDRQKLSLAGVSLAKMVTVVVPTRNVEPLAGSLTRLAIPQLSVALTF